MTEKEVDKIGELATVVFAKPVYDEDDQKLIKVTPAMQDEAWQRYEHLKELTYDAAKELYLIKERKLYLALGFNSFKSFYQNTGMSRSKAKREVRLGEKLANLKKGGPTLDPPREGEVTSSLIDEVGHIKLIELTRLSQEQFDALLSGSDVQGYTLDDVRKQTSRETARMVTAVQRGADKQTLARLKTDLELAKAEKNVLQQQIKDNDKLLKHARELEAKYDIEDRGTANRIKILEEANRALNTFLHIATKISIEPGDTDAVVSAASALLLTFKTRWDPDGGNGLEARLENMIGEAQD